MRPKSRYCCVVAVLLAAGLSCRPPTAARAEAQTAPSVATPGVPAYRGGVVAVSEPLAAQVGARVLRDGGNAIDAAVAIQFALNVVEPQSSGIGGGGFLLVHLADRGKTWFLDSRETAPAGATPDMLAGPGDFDSKSTSGLAAGVPGTLLGMAEALRRWGTISLADSLAPGIELAERGFPIGPTLADRVRDARVAHYKEARDRFRPQGAPLQVGDLLVQPELAKTFRLIAKHGTDVFYRGEIAAAIVAAQRQTRATFPQGVGRMTRADLASYRVAVREPVVLEYRGYVIKSAPPPSSGGLTLGQMLEMVERFPLGDAAAGYGFATAKTLHVMLEATRLAYADRSLWMGDGDFFAVPAAGLLHPDYLRQRSSLIRADRRLVAVTPGDPRSHEPGGHADKTTLAPPLEGQEGHSTTHYAVVDRWGNVVSHTTTIESTWGTGIMVPGYGFFLNNELTDFNLLPRYNPDPAHFDPGANDVAPGKRPRSSMAPAIVFQRSSRGGDEDDRGALHPVLAYGSPGGATIINTVFHITVNLIDHGMAMQEAIDAPRVSRTSTSDSGLVLYEPGLSPMARQGLAELGHALAPSPLSIGSVQAVVIDLETGLQYGGADKRRDGTVIGIRRAASGER